VHYRDLSPAPRTSRRPAASAVSVQRARHINATPGTQWRPEREAARIPRAHPDPIDRGHAERNDADRSALERSPDDRCTIDLGHVSRIASDRGHAERIPDRGYVDRSPGDRSPGDRSLIERSRIDRSPVERSHTDRIASGRSPVERIPSDRSRFERIPGDRSPVERVPGNRSHVDRIASDRGPAERFHRDLSALDRNDPIVRNIDRSRIRLEPEWRSAPPKSGLERGVLLISAGLIVGAAGCFWLLYNVFGAPALMAPPQAILAAPSVESNGAAVVMRSGKSDSLARSIHPMMQQMARADAIGAIDRAALAPEAPAKANTGPTRVVQTPSYFAPQGKESAKETKNKESAK